MVLEAVFGFLLAYHPSVSVAIYAVIVLVLINIFYRLLINQGEARQLKEKVRELGKQMRAEQKAGNKEKANQLMSEMMQSNAKTMRMTMKPMIVSFIVVIIFLPVMNTFYSDASVQLQDGRGTLKIGGSEYAVERAGSEINVGGLPCTPTCIMDVGQGTYEISAAGDTVHFSRIVTLLPVALPWVGTTLGWLGWYIIVSIPLAIVIRKLLRIYV